MLRMKTSSIYRLCHKTYKRWEEDWASQPMLSQEESARVQQSQNRELISESSNEAPGDWCSCGKCDNGNMDMPDRERLCCQHDTNSNTYRLQSDKFDPQKAPADCVTDRKAFQYYCLSKRALELTYKEYQFGLYGQLPSNGQAKFRYTAYRQYVKFVHDRLGRGNRIIIPHCVI